LIKLKLTQRLFSLLSCINFYVYVALITLNRNSKSFYLGKSSVLQNLVVSLFCHAQLSLNCLADGYLSPLGGDVLYLERINDWSADGVVILQCELVGAG